MSESEAKKRVTNIQHVLLTGYIPVEIGEGSWGTRPLTDKERKDLEVELKTLLEN